MEGTGVKIINMNWKNVKFADAFAVIGYLTIIAFFFYIAYLASVEKTLDANVGGIVTGLMTLLVMTFNHYYKSDKRQSDNKDNV